MEEIQLLRIIGGGGFGREVRSFVTALNYRFDGFIDDDPRKQEVIGAIKPEAFSNKQRYCLAIGSSRNRRSIIHRLFGEVDSPGFISDEDSFPNLVHPSAIIQEKESVTLGFGNILTALNVLTCNIRIGNFCVINLNCTIGHDVVINDFCSLMPSVNLGGQVRLGEAVYIGTGATVLPGIQIGDNAVVGAGAVVTKDVPPATTVIGIPARPVS